jgi:hypothetical protein
MRARIVLMSAVGLMGLGVLCVLVFREPMETLTADALAEARSRWMRAGVRSYAMELKFGDGQYHVTVVDGAVTELLRDGQTAHSNRPADFSVEGVFDTLERELELKDAPNTPFGGNAILQVRFDPKRGYVHRYLRAVGGAGRSTIINVERLDPM